MLDRNMAERFDDIWVEMDEMWDKAKVQTRAVSKIHGERTKVRRIRKRTFVVLAAAVIAVVGTFSFGAERDWDIRFAELTGIGDVMADLPGGYKEIGVSQTAGGITVTVSQAIGDQSSQWVQIDTTMPWEGGEAAWDVFETIDLHAYDGERLITGGNSVEPMNRDGKLSFMFYMTGYDGINEADMELTAVLRSGEVMKIFWKNAYAANAEILRPFKTVTLHEEGREDLSCIVTKIEVTPVSLNLKAWTNPLNRAFDASKSAYLAVDAVILEDGTAIEVDGFDVAGMKSSGMLDCFVSLADVANGRQIKAITIGDVTFER